MKPIETHGWTEKQLQAALDLLVIGMYSDNHLALAEDERIQRFLAAMGSQSPYDRERLLDAAVTRVRPYVGSKEASLAMMTALADCFETLEFRRKVAQTLEDLLQCDRAVTVAEAEYLRQVREALGV